MVESSAADGIYDAMLQLEAACREYALLDLSSTQGIRHGAHTAVSSLLDLDLDSGEQPGSDSQDNGRHNHQDRNI